MKKGISKNVCQHWFWTVCQILWWICTWNLLLILYLDFRVLSQEMFSQIRNRGLVGQHVTAQVALRLAVIAGNLCEVVPEAAPSPRFRLVHTGFPKGDTRGDTVRRSSRQWREIGQGSQLGRIANRMGLGRSGGSSTKITDEIPRPATADEFPNLKFWKIWNDKEQLQR